MIWTLILANLKWIIAGALSIWAAIVFRENGRKDEELKHTKGENKKLNDREQFQVSQIKRGEQKAKELRDYAKTVEDTLAKVDPDALTAIQLDRMSEDPLSFANLPDSSGEPTKSTENEDD